MSPAAVSPSARFRYDNVVAKTRSMWRPADSTPSYANEMLEHEAPPLTLSDWLEDSMRKNTEQKKQKCKNCEGKGTLKKGDKIVRCQRCGGTGIKA